MKIHDFEAGTLPYLEAYSVDPVVGSIEVTESQLVEVISVTSKALASSVVSLASAPNAAGVPAQSDVASAMNFILDDILGLDASALLVNASVSTIVGENGFLQLKLSYKPGIWPTDIVKNAAELDIFSEKINVQKLLQDRSFVLDLQGRIKSQIDKSVTRIVDDIVSETSGYTRGVATAASTSIKALLSSKIATTITGTISDSLLTLTLPDRTKVIDILDASFDEIGSTFFKTFVPELAKTYGKIAVTEILEFASDGLSPAWATAVKSIGKGVLEPVITNIVENYRFELSGLSGPPVSILYNVEFSEVFGKAIANLLVDFKALDKKIIDDILGIDGSGFIDKQVSDFLSKQINALTEKGFVKAVEFLSGDITAENVQKFFDGIQDAVAIADIQNFVGKFFVKYASDQLVKLVVDIDSLPESLVSQLGSYLAGEAIGSAINAATLPIVTSIFGNVTSSVIGGAIFNGITAVLGAGIGAIAGSLLFEFLDDLFDGGIGRIFNGIIEAIRNRSPQAFYGIGFNPDLNEFVNNFDYSKHSNDQMRAAVKAISDAIESKIEAVIDFVGEKASFTPGYNNITTAWGEKHFSSSYATYINGNENSKLAFTRDGNAAIVETIGAVLRNMSFGSQSNPVALAYEQWKTEVANSIGQSNAAFASADAAVLLQEIVGLAHFANDYRQDPELYDRLIASDSAVGITILQQYLKAEERGHNDARNLIGSELGQATIGSAGAGDFIYVNGPANQVLARGGDDSIRILSRLAGSALTIDGGTGVDFLVIPGTRQDFTASIADLSLNNVKLTHIATKTVIDIRSVELFLFRSGDQAEFAVFPPIMPTRDGALTFSQAFSNSAPVFASFDGADRALVEVVSNTPAKIDVSANDVNGNVLTYAISGGADAAAFQIDQVSGQLSFKVTPSASDLKDSNRDNVYEVIVEARDGQLSDRQILDIRVVGDGNIVQGTNLSDVIDSRTRPNGDPGTSNREDTVYGGDGNDTIFGGDGGDFLLGDGGIDTIFGEGGNDRIFGWVGNDSLIGGPGNDLISGETGNDTLDGGPGADALDGGFGFDYASYASANARVLADLVVWAINTGEAAGDVYTAIEGLIGSRFGDDLRGTGGDNWIYGGAGADIAYGRAGNDVLLGEGGDDILWGNEGNDALYGGAGLDRLLGGAGADLLNGEGDFDFAHYDDATSGITVDLASNAFNAGGALGDQLFNIEGLVGSFFNDRLLGDGITNWLYGGDGNDVIDGRGGDDVLIAGNGNDTVFGSDGNDLMFGEIGDDTLVGGNGNDRIDGGVGADVLFGGAGADVLIGNLGFDYVSYEGAAGGVTADIVVWGNNSGEAAGDQLIEVEGIVGSAFNDSLRGDAGANFLFGLAGADFIFGRGGNDVLVGGDGDDTLFGNEGNDAIYVGTGNDRVVFGAGDGRDSIYEFSAGAGVGDVIQLAASLGITSFTQLQGRMSQVGADTLISFDAATSITIIGVAPAALAANDFIFG